MIFLKLKQKQNTAAKAASLAAVKEAALEADQAKLVETKGQSIEVNTISDEEKSNEEGAE
ncbi:hypothetical protein [Mycoplasmopsis felis]|uniref:hypothetical protein n=1 Tax=Mycoplasmopsis felis TaxID=33923 RepID=UPI003A5C7CD6